MGVTIRIISKNEAPAYRQAGEIRNKHECSKYERLKEILKFRILGF